MSTMRSPAPAPKSALSSSDKQGMLENFDLEVVDRTRIFQKALSTILDSILRRTETELANIPKQMRGLTMQEVNASWGGDWGVTMMKIKEAALKGKEQGEGGLEGRVEEMRKRKRAGDARDNDQDPGGPSRKTARIQPPSQPIKRPLLSSKRTTTKPLPSSRRLTRSSLYPTSPTPAPTSLPTPTRPFPSAPVFAPTLPSTPQYPRQPRPNESLLSANGSPLENPWSDSEGENDLPDAAELEREIMEASVAARAEVPLVGSGGLFGLLGRGSKSRSRKIDGIPLNNGSKPRRVSFIRPAYQPYHTPAASKSSASVAPPAQATPEIIKESGSTMRIDLPNGSQLIIDLLTANPGVLERELGEGGILGAPRAEIMREVKGRILKLRESLQAEWGEE